MNLDDIEKMFSKNYVKEFKQIFINEDICKNCLVSMIEDEGMMVCLQCGRFHYNLVNSYGDDERFIIKF